MRDKQKSFLTHYRRQGGTLEEAETFLHTHEPTSEMLKSLDLYYKIKSKKRKLKQLISLFSSQDVKNYLEKQENREKVKKVDEISIEERKKRQKKLLECRIPDKKPEQGKQGRKTRYDRSKDKVVQKLYALGASDKEVHDTLGICRATYYEWRSKHQSFEDACYIGKDYYRTQQAEDALARRMVGYTENIKEVVLDGDKNVKEIRVKPRHVPADTRALSYFLNNRKPERWKDKVEHSNDGEQQTALDKLIAAQDEALGK